MKSLPLFILLFCSLLCPAPGAGAETRLEPAQLGLLTARQVGPAAMSGRVSDIVCHPWDTRVIYIGTAAGGIWKTENGGVTFKQVFNGKSMSIGALALDPARPDRIWAGTGESKVRNSVSLGGGVYLSEDGGRSWQFKGLAESERIARIVIHPQKPDTVYVAALGRLWNSGGERGVYRTEDGGAGWERILYVDEDTGCADLEIDRQEPEILYAAMWQFRRSPDFFVSGGPGSGLYRSLNGGRDWSRLEKGLPAGNLGRISLAAAPSRKTRIYANVEAEKSGFYSSDDRGENWQLQNSSTAVTARPFYFSRFTVDPRDHNRIYMGGLYFSISRDGGRTFHSPMISGGGLTVHPDIHPIWVDPQRPDRVLLGTDGGVYESWDGGATFRHFANLPLSQFYHVAYDFEYPYNVYGGLQDNGSWYGPSSAPGPGVRNRDWRNIGAGDGFYVLPHPEEPDIIYYSWQGGRLQRFNRRTLETKDIRPYAGPGEAPLRFNWDAAVALGPVSPELLYFGAQYLFRSADRGDSWQRISPDLTRNDPARQRQAESGGLSRENTSAENHCTIVSIAPSPLDENLIWVGTDDGNLQLTRDGGRSWRNLTASIPGLPPFTWCSGIEAGRFSPGTVYAVFDGHRHGDMKTYLYRSHDYGASWQSLFSDDLRGYAHVIREDPQRRGMLYLGTEAGLFLSLDDGASWLHLDQVLPPVPVFDLAVHPREHDLIIGTHGLGVYIIDDLSPLRALDSEVLNSEAALLPSRPAVISIPFAPQDFPGDAEFLGVNPSRQAQITYYLKKRHIFGDLKLEVLDEAGLVIQSLPTSKNAGLNRVSWSMRYPAPKIASSRGFPRFLAEGPQVPAGIYRLRLTRGQQVYYGSLELKHDPLVDHSPQDRLVRNELIMKMYRLQEELTPMADTLASWRRQLEEIREAGRKSGRRLPALVARISSRLEEFHGRMLVSEGLFVADRLRERIMDLYSVVSRYGGRPTDSQVEQGRVLAAEMEQVKSEYRDLLARERPAWNRGLRSAGLAALPDPLDRESKD